MQPDVGGTTLFIDHLKEHAELNGEKIAVVSGSQQISYADLLQSAQCGAQKLRDLGLQQEMVLASCMDNNIEQLALHYAVALNGAAICTVDPMLTNFEIAQIFEDCRPEFVVSDHAYRDKVLDCLGLAKHSAHIVGDESGQRSTKELLYSKRPVRFDAPHFDDAEFLIQYTSGSTGRPKGVVQTQLGLVRRIFNWTSTSNITSDDSHYCILPLSHGYGNYCIAFPALATGGTLHLEDLKKLSPRKVLTYLNEFRITCFFGLPYFYRLLSSTPRSFEVDLSCLKIAMIGSAPVNQETLDGFSERFGVMPNNCYGTSEAGIISYNPGTDCAPSLSIGKLINGMEMRLEGNYEINGSEYHELWVRTDGMAERYFTPDAGQVCEDGWQQTGDLVKVDDQLYLMVGGRLSQFINVSGNKVMPEEIEDVIMELPCVAEVGVTSIDDALTGEKVAAIIVLADGQSRAASGSDVTAEILKHCSGRLINFKVPTKIAYTQKLPKNPVGKVQRKKLSSLI